MMTWIEKTVCSSLIQDEIARVSTPLRLACLLKCHHAFDISADGIRTNRSRVPMTTTLLHLIPTDDDTAPELSADAIRVFSAALGSRINLSEPQPMTAAKAPAAFEAAFVLEAGCDVQAVTKAVIAAFAAVGIAQGSYEISVSEHDDDDTDFEAPAYFEQVVELGPGATG